MVEFSSSMLTCFMIASSIILYTKDCYLIFVFVVDFVFCFVRLLLFCNVRVLRLFVCCCKVRFIIDCYCNVIRRLLCSSVLVVL